MGWFWGIIVGGFAGWIASKVMDTNTGILINIVLGVVGAFVANLIFGFLGVSFSGTIGNLIAGLVGAIILIYGYRALSK
jgi:uncharacterized membrane protein YeaQ/YmgE (transglycosylase-associated protein family)